MKTNKYVEDLQAKSAAALAEDLVAAKKELFIKEVRRNIARIQTVITQKQKEA